ncbi:MAG: NUDIX domain-containing protein [Candidatus Methanoculleus thermohydrogenotrophicum]
MDLLLQRVEKINGRRGRTGRSSSGGIGDLQYLILQYGAGHRDLVKRHGERSESEKETVPRELEEETGITRATFIPGFREAVHYLYLFQRRRTTVYKEVIYYLVETPEEEVLLSEEDHIDYRWLPLDETLQAIDHLRGLKTADRTGP